MRLERLASNKIKIFFTFDDLFERGVTAEDIKGNSLKVHKLFQDMVEEACQELDFKMNGSVAVEIFSLQAQGLVIIVTREDEEQIEEEDYLELDVKIGVCPHILFAFEDFEDVIQLSHCLKYLHIFVSSLYHYGGNYYLLIEEVSERLFEPAVSLAAEYGRASTLTLPRLDEYGVCLVEGEAVRIVTDHFRK